MVRQISAGVAVIAVIVAVVTATDPANDICLVTATSEDTVIESCCDLGYKHSIFSQTVNKSKLYKMKNFCKNCRSTITSGYCDTLTDNGGWLVIQRRKDGSVSFDRDWIDYENGFGDLDGEFWYGLYAIHCLTSNGHWQLRIDFKFRNGSASFLKYNHFQVGSPLHKYTLSISGYYDYGLPDLFAIDILNGMKFTTRDQDNDLSGGNCAVANGAGNPGGWWYRVCSAILLNGKYNHPKTVSFYEDGKWVAVPFVEMKIRPIDCIV